MTFMPNLFAVDSNGLILKLSRKPALTPVFHTAFFASPAQILAWSNQLKDKMNLNGDVVKVGTIHYPPFALVKRHSSGEISFSGFEVTIAREVIKTLNGSAFVSTPENGLPWETIDDATNTITGGVFGAVIEGDMDMAGLGVWVLHRLLTVLEYSQPYDVERVCFVATKPDKMPQSLALIKAFKPRVWVFVFVSVICSGLLLVLHRVISDSHQKLPSYGHTLLLILSIMTVESDPWFHFLRKSSLLCFLPPFVLCFFVLSSGYSTGMVALLTVPLRDPPINTFKGIVQAGITPASKTVTVDIFTKESVDPWLIKIKDSFEQLAVSMPFDEALQATLDRKYILIQSETFLKHSINNQFTNRYGETDLHIVEQCPLTNNIAMIMPNGNILKPAVDRVILQFSAAGLIDFWKKNAIGTRASVSGASVESDLQPFTLDNLQGHFLVAFGSLFGPCLMVFAFEFKICNWITNFMKKQLNQFKAF